MKETVVKKFIELFKLRCDNYRLLNFGEDSVRYDFFCAIAEILKLQPWQIQLEYAMNSDAYTLRANKDSKRKEKPMLDLIIDTAKINLCIEFALFRQNSNDDGDINKTERTVKMVNDMIRLALESFYSKREAYFICVADSKMLKHQLRSRVIGRFPSNYEIDAAKINTMSELKSGDFDERFVNKFKTLKSKIKSELICNQEIKAKKITLETRVLIWKITMTK